MAAPRRDGGAAFIPVGDEVFADGAARLGQPPAALGVAFAPSHPDRPVVVGISAI